MTESLYYIFCGVLSVTVIVGISLMSKVKTAVARAKITPSDTAKAGGFHPFRPLLRR